MVDLLTAIADPGDRRPWSIATVITVDTTTSRMLVSIDGGEADLPFGSGEYVAGDTVAVIRDPGHTGAGQFVLARIGSPPAPAAPVPPPPPVPTTQTATAVIHPTWSGTWRTSRAAYDRWNTSRYGGASSLYQGDDHGSSRVIGIATYGDQIAGLGALSIESITVDVVIATGRGVPVLQPSTQRTAYPGIPAPDPAAAAVGGEGTPLLPPTTYEGWRTGVYGSLVLVGGDYLAVRGTSLGNGMVLRVAYTKAV